MTPWLVLAGAICIALWIGWKLGYRRASAHQPSADKSTPNTTSTTKKSSAEDLNFSHQDLALAMESGGIAVWRYDPREKILTSIVGSLIGIKEHVSLDHFLQYVHEDDRESVQALLRRRQLQRSLQQ